MEKKTNERMMKSQESMNELDRKIQSKHKGTTGSGFTDEGESSQQGAQKNKRPTCSHFGKIGHTSNKCWSNGKCYNCSKHGHRASECKDKSKFEGKCFNCNKQGHKSSECTTKNRNLVEQFVKAILGWDYNTWCRCYYVVSLGTLERFV